MKKKILLTHILFSMIFFSSCSSVSLNENSGITKEGVAPIKNAKNINTDKETRKKNQLSEKPLDPIEYKKYQNARKALDNFRSLEPSVYFDYDKFQIQNHYQTVIKSASEIMLMNNNYSIIIEGHSDERGTTEYNLALGQKRAEAVAKALELLGISRKKIEVISLGEERPNAFESNEAAWAKNRRADLIIR